MVEGGAFRRLKHVHEFAPIDQRRANDGLTLIWTAPLGLLGRSPMSCFWAARDAFFVAAERSFEELLRRQRGDQSVSSLCFGSSLD